MCLQFIALVTLYLMCHMHFKTIAMKKCELSGAEGHMNHPMKK